VARERAQGFLLDERGAELRARQKNFSLRKRLLTQEEQEWTTLQEIFPFKRKITLRYEALRMTVEGRQPDWTP
jgi:hypothetical protein